MSPHEELFRRLLDESSALLAAPENGGITIPDDELHREIIVPLLPAMLADATIRGHWSEQAATGFVARIGRHFENGESAPRWLPADFEIHVTASYSSGADARALADTLLSEEPLRDMTAALMNQLLDALWLSLAPVPSATAGELQIGIEIGAAEIPTEEIPAIPEAIIPPETKSEPEPGPAPPVEVEPNRAVEILPAPAQPSRALVRALCGGMAASAVQRGWIARYARGASAAIIARRILHRTAPSRKKKGAGSRTACLG